MPCGLLAPAAVGLQVCPYYGSRRAVPQVDVILAPYSTILMPDACESMGIQLKDAVVVFDEAHNLLDAINGAHSTAVSGQCRPLGMHTTSGQRLVRVPYGVSCWQAVRSVTQRPGATLGLARSSCTAQQQMPEQHNRV